MFGRIKKKKLSDRTDLKIERKKYDIILFRYTEMIQWLADMFLGIFFIIGGILNLLDLASFYANLSYFLGSLAMTVRPIIKVYRHIQIKERSHTHEGEKRVYHSE